jgi:HSP20 family protein
MFDVMGAHLARLERFEFRDTLERTWIGWRFTKTQHISIGDMTMTGLIRFSPLAARSFGASPFAYAPADFDRAIDSIASQFFNGTSGADALLRADVAETDTSYVLRLDVPGVSKDHINVTVDDKLVKIEVNFTATAVEGEKSLRSERANGSATRSFRLPISVNSDAATATHELGVLTLTLPKQTAAMQKRIAIN